MTINARAIPEPVYNIFRVFRIGYGGNENAWFW